MNNPFNPTANIGEVVVASLNNGLWGIMNFIPKFIAGLIILLIGIVVASLVKRIVLELLKAVKMEMFLHRYGVPEAKDEFSWTNILTEIVRWFIIILFLIPAASIWGLPQVATVLNTFVLYLPNVFVAAIIAVVGFVFARLAYDVVLASTHGLSRESAKTIASTTRWAVIVFTLLAVLNQLGVAADLVRILFTGFVAMVAIAGGIAFGLGGQTAAKDLVDDIKKRLR